MSGKQTHFYLQNEMNTASSHQFTSNQLLFPNAAIWYVYDDFLCFDEAAEALLVLTPERLGLEMK